MIDVTNEASEKAKEASPAPGATDVSQTATARKVKVRKVMTMIKRHPLGFVVAIGAAAALVEIELAVGILTGLGATALLATKSGPEARQEVVAKGQEVFTKGKAAIERARVALANRTTKVSAAAAPAVEPPAPPAA